METKQNINKDTRSYVGRRPQKRVTAIGLWNAADETKRQSDTRERAIRERAIARDC